MGPRRDEDLLLLRRKGASPRIGSQRVLEVAAVCSSEACLRLMGYFVARRHLLHLHLSLFLERIGPRDRNERGLTVFEVEVLR